jgi:hypothetical protein
MTDFDIAQYNYARARAEPSEAEMAGFTTRLDEINTLADKSEGFVWRLKTERGDAIDIRPYDDPLMLITLSVWRGIEPLREYVYRGDHAGLLRRREEWFEEPDGIYLVLWWVPRGHIPDVEEGKERLEHLIKHGPTPYAFTFARTFDPPSTTGEEA